MSETKKTKSFFKSDRNKIVAVVLASTLVIGGSFGVQAVASSKTFQHLQLAASEPSETASFIHQAGWSKGHRHGHRMRFSEMSDAEIEKKINRVVRHVAIEIDATDDQTTKITALLTALAKDMKPLRADMKAAGKQIHDLLLEDAVDRAKLERIRAERLAEFDRISKDVTTALADVAEVLTAEQRRTLDERIKEFKSMRGGWKRGWHRG